MLAAEAGRLDLAMYQQALNVLYVFQHLAKCFNLRSMSMLGPNAVGDAGMKAVVMNKKLQKLCIESNQIITDYTMKCLAKCCLLLAHL